MITPELLPRDIDGVSAGIRVAGPSQTLGRVAVERRRGCDGDGRSASAVEAQLVRVTIRDLVVKAPAHVRAGGAMVDAARTAVVVAIVAP